jgi:AsmA protein
MVRKVIYIAGGVILVLLLIVIVLPFVIDANRFRPQIESAADSALNRKVEIGSIRLSIFSGGISVDNLAMSDDPHFSNGPFLKAKSVAVSVELWPLLFSRAIHITGLTVDQPEVTLLRSPSGTWNFSTLGTSAPQKTKADAAADSAGSNTNSDVSVRRLTIKNGTLFVGNTGANAKQQKYDQVNLQSSDLSYVTQFPFQLTARTPGNGAIKLAGKAGPLNREDAAQTPLQADLEVQNLDLRSTGFIEPSSGIAGLLDFNGKLASDGRQMTSQGKLNAKKLQLVPGGSPAGQPVEIDYETVYDLKPQTGVVRRGDVRIGKALAHLTGNYSSSGETTSVQMKLTGENLPASDLESVLPALGVTLPSGASLREGTLNANLSISGPVNRLVTTGPVNLSNAKLTGFDLGSKLSAMSALTGVQKMSDTPIQTLSCDVRIAPDGIRADKLNLVVPTIGAMAGDGTISADHKLDFKMVAHLSGSTSNALSQVTALAGIGQGAGGSAIPFRIQGTTSNPVFVPDVAGIAGGLAKGAVSGSTSGSQPNGQDLGRALGDKLGGLFGKKKNPQ